MSSRRGGPQRHRLSIIYQILVTCNGKPVGSLRICRHVNLNSVFFHKLANGLIQCGFLSEHTCDGHTLYVTSQQGFDFIKKYYEMLSVAERLERVFGEKLL